MKAKSTIDAVTFDVWQTLLLERDGWSLRRRNARCENLSSALKELDLGVDIEQLKLAFENLDSWLAGIWSSNREVTHLDQIKFLIKAASEGSLTVEEEWVDRLSSAYVSAIFSVPPYLNPEAPRVLQWLKDRGKLIGLICNVGLTPGLGLRKILEKFGVAEYFDLMIFSDEVGFRKPDPRMFHEASDELELEPCRIVHIGDNLRSDIWGAKNVGFRAVYLSTGVGRDSVEESNPESLISISRRLSTLNEDQTVPDKTVTSLVMVIDAIEELEIRAEI